LHIFSDHIGRMPIKLRVTSQLRGLPNIHLSIIQSYFCKYDSPSGAFTKDATA
jgi:hypothetical protein